jgi:hypothetical protein
MILFATRYGIGVSPDSVVHIGGGRNLIAGYGFSLLSGTGDYAPITHHAPLYAALLAVPGFFGIELGQTAKVLNALLFSANIFILGLMVSTLSKSISPAAWILPTAGAWLMLISYTMVELHLMAWTEAVFILLMLITIALLAAYLNKPRVLFLLASAVAAGLALLTRYAGLSLVLTGFLGILFFLPSNLLSRIRIAAVFFLVSVTPIVLWLGRNFLMAGTAANREFIFHPVSKNQLWIGLTTISGWLGVSESAPTLLKLVPVAAAGIGMLALIFLSRRNRSSIIDGNKTEEGKQIPETVKISLTFFLVYIAFLVFSVSFFDANTPLDNRILSPIYVVGLLVALFGVISLITLKPDNFSVKTGVFILGIWLTMNYLSTSINLVSSSYREGIGLNSREWLQSETLNELEIYSPEIVIYSNAPDAIYLHTGRPAVSLPRKYERASQRVNHNYSSDLVNIQNLVDSNQALIVYFSTLNRPNISTEEELSTDLRLDVVANLSDGKIFGPIKSARYP